jgi:hypothetical protein
MHAQSGHLYILDTRLTRRSFEGLSGVGSWIL